MEWRSWAGRVAPPTFLGCFALENNAYHLSLYKQVPEWPRVVLSLTHFPLKNVTSCYSEGKKTLRFHLSSFFTFFYFTNTKTFIILQIHILSPPFPILILPLILFLFFPTRSSFSLIQLQSKTMLWCCCSPNAGREWGNPSLRKT